MPDVSRRSHPLIANQHGCQHGCHVHNSTIAVFWGWLSSMGARGATREMVGARVAPWQRLKDPPRSYRDPIPENLITKLSFDPPLYVSSYESAPIGKSAEFVLPPITTPP